MRSLSRLLDQIRELGDGEAAAEGLPRPADRDAPPALGETVSAEELRRRLGAFLSALAERVEGELTRVLQLAWDQIDSLALLDAEAWREARRVRAMARAQEASADPADHAEALAAGVTLDAAMGVVSMVERRLAALVRLRGTQPLVAGGRPFLDLAPALAEAARAWR